jgi:hypothetical protein
MLCLLIAACSKASDSKEAPAKQEPAQEAVKEPAPVKDEVDPQTVKPPEAAPVSPAANVDCAAIVTADDIQKACNAKVELRATQYEGKNPKLGLCSRAITEPGKKFPVAQWSINAFEKPADAEGWVKLEKTADAKELAGVGDLAWTREKHTAALKTTTYSVGVRKGGMVLKLSFTKNSLNERPPCTLEQLVEVAKVATSRLP